MKDFVKHYGYNKYKDIWERVRDAIEGQDQIKNKSTKYLKKLNGQSSDSYSGYLDRAQFINYSSKTLEAALGQLFRKNPIVQDIKDEYLENIDLQGRSFYYFSRYLASEVMQTNRAGIMIDYSEELKRPYLTLFNTEKIINWHTKIIRGEKILDFIIIEGYKEIENPENKYEIKKEKMWKVLFLDNDSTYKVEDYVRNKQGDLVIENEYIPLMNNTTLNFIPFYFVTNSGISFDLSKSILVDFVNVNLGHYKDSADYQNMLHWTGAKTPCTKGYNKDILPIGGCIDLPIDGDAFFLEASSDSGLKEEMGHKEEQMAVIGNSIITGKGRYVASAETARLTNESEFACLSDIANSLSVSMKNIMNVFNEWAGDNKEAVIEYNTDYESKEIDGITLSSWISAYQSGNISWETFFYNLQQREVYPEGWTIEKEKMSIEGDQTTIKEGSNGFQGKNEELDQE